MRKPQTFRLRLSHIVMGAFWVLPLQFLADGLGEKLLTLGGVEVLQHRGADHVLEGLAFQQGTEHGTADAHITANVEQQMVQACETAECLCQGLKNIFHYIGGVPWLMVIDNATGAGQRMGEVIRLTELFQRI